jgi:hypothetical protein
VRHQKAHPVSICFKHWRLIRGHVIGRLRCAVGIPVGGAGHGVVGACYRRSARPAHSIRHRGARVCKGGSGGAREALAGSAYSARRNRFPHKGRACVVCVCVSGSAKTARGCTARGRSGGRSGRWGVAHTRGRWRRRDKRPLGGRVKRQSRACRKENNRAKHKGRKVPRRLPSRKVCVCVCVWTLPLSTTLNTRPPPSTCLSKLYTTR